MAEINITQAAHAGHLDRGEKLRRHMRMIRVLGMVSRCRTAAELAITAATTHLHIRARREGATGVAATRAPVIPADT